MRKHVFVIGGLPESLINFRGDLLLSLREHGCEVSALAGQGRMDVAQKLKKSGIEFIPLSIKRNGFNPVGDLLLFWQLYKAFKEKKPNVIFAYTIKPIIWGGLAARIIGIPFYGLVTGLGFAFQGESLKRRLLTGLVRILYRSALKSSEAVVFQNTDNSKLFIELGIVPESKCRIVNGSGVNVNTFVEKPLPITRYGGRDIVFLCIARLLKEKGLREYAEAARIVKKVYPKVIFNLVGPLDPSPDSIKLEEVESWDAISYQGETNNVKPYIESADVYVLPSYHEGLPRSTLEAMAMGRPILTTDAVGCRNTVENGINGFKVPVGNSKDLADRMNWCITNRNELQNMGKASRSMVLEKFDVVKVNAELLKIMGVDGEATN